MFSSLRSTYHRNRCTYKNNINLIFSFLQCALLNSVIFSSNFVFYLLKEYTMFSYFKVTYQINRSTFKNNIKSHIFLQCAHSDFFFLHQSLCFTYSHSLKHFFYSNGTYIKRWTFKIRLKSHNFSFKSAPCQIFFFFAWKFFLYLRTQFSIFSSFKGTYQRNKCTLKKW
jgi:hypothetical protein